MEVEVEVVDMIQGTAKVYIENSRINIDLSRDKVFASENGHLICICKYSFTVESLFSLRKASRWK